MTQSKTSRAFRTISEAADELDLQSHVLRFWESKFSDIQPMKRRGGRRFYRPEDIEFLRGIKILLHREKHPIKDVQKLIRIRGAQSVRDLGRSVEKAAKPRAVKDTNLVPKRIKPVADKPIVITAKPKVEDRPHENATTNTQQEKPIKAYADTNHDIVRRSGFVDSPVAKRTPVLTQKPETVPAVKPPSQQKTKISESELGDKDKSDLKDALNRLKSLRTRWQDFT